MTTRDDAPLGAPCWIDLLTSDTEGAMAFYGSLFGWTAEVGGEEHGGYITFSKDGVPVAGGMGNDESSGTPDLWTTYLAVADAKATVAAAVAHGGMEHLGAMDIPGAGVMAMVGDPGGAAVGLWQPGEHRGFGVLAEPGAPAWFELFTRDHAAVMRFYEDVFGWDTHVAGDTDELRYSTLGKDEDALAGVMDASAFLPDGVPAHWSVYFAVEDADASVATAVGLGATVVVPAEDTPYGRLVTLTDPTGASFKLLGPNTG